MCFFSVVLKSAVSTFPLTSHLNGRGSVLFLQDEEIGGYMVQQNVAGRPVTVFRFPPRTRLKALSHATVCYQWDGIGMAKCFQIVLEYQAFVSPNVCEFSRVIPQCADSHHRTSLFTGRGFRLPTII